MLKFAPVLSQLCWKIWALAVGWSRRQAEGGSPALKRDTKPQPHSTLPDPKARADGDDGARGALHEPLVEAVVLQGASRASATGKAPETGLRKCTRKGKHEKRAFKKNLSFHLGQELRG